MQSRAGTKETAIGNKNMPLIKFPEFSVPDFEYEKQADGLHKLLTNPEARKPFNGQAFSCILTI